MKWIKRKIRNWLQEEVELERDAIVSSVSTREPASAGLLLV